jgi:CRISPR-associated protein Csx17
VLGHALKAVGLLRALAECADWDARDSSAEGWWDPDTATFRIRSDRYPDADSLTKFFTEKYRPTPLLAPWHKTGGVTDNIEVVIVSNVGDVEQFRRNNEALLDGLGLKKTKKRSASGALVFVLNRGVDPSSVGRIATSAGLSCRHKQKNQKGKQVTEVTIAADRSPLEDFLRRHREQLDEFGLTEAKSISPDGILKFASESSSRGTLVGLVEEFNRSGESGDSPSGSHDPTEPPGDRLQIVVTQKESGKMDGAVPRAAALLRVSGVPASRARRSS